MTKGSGQPIHLEFYSGMNKARENTDVSLIGIKLRINPTAPDPGGTQMRKL